MKIAPRSSREPAIFAFRWLRSRRAERRRLLDSLVPGQEFLPEIRRFVLDRAAGNPCFFEEMTRMCAKSCATTPR